MEWAVVQENVPEEDSIFPVKMSWQQILQCSTVLQDHSQQGQEHSLCCSVALSTWVNYVTAKQKSTLFSHKLYKGMDLAGMAA